MRVFAASLVLENSIDPDWSPSAEDTQDNPALEFFANVVKKKSFGYDFGLVKSEVLADFKRGLRLILHNWNPTVHGLGETPTLSIYVVTDRRMPVLLALTAADIKRIGVIGWALDFSIYGAQKVNRAV